MVIREVLLVRKKGRSKSSEVVFIYINTMFSLVNQTRTGEMPFVISFRAIGRRQ